MLGLGWIEIVICIIYETKEKKWNYYIHTYL